LPAFPLGQLYWLKMWATSSDMPAPQRARGRVFGTPFLRTDDAEPLKSKNYSKPVRNPEDVNFSDSYY